ncbi:hypothetical protein QUF99_16795 [Bacillus sp. DX4.1]|uniref:VOC family protein n=1 Tax=Bacillus sp. DX4.1 TaxID=3055867 RepID=UPI0025A082FC|nr:hypothetical protein [Bacillus sp. DX4.1]MDM5188916.1 hypothetical protein [Bacillus sp. DX4.1]
MGRVIGFELNNQEPEKALTFYSKVFNWKAATLNFDYWAITTGNDRIPGSISVAYTYNYLNLN